MTECGKPVRGGGRQQYNVQKEQMRLMGRGLQGFQRLLVLPDSRKISHTAPGPGNRAADRQTTLVAGARNGGWQHSHGRRGSGWLCDFGGKGCTVSIILVDGVYSEGIVRMDGAWSEGTVMVGGACTEGTVRVDGMVLLAGVYSGWWFSPGGRSMQWLMV